jgi:hypothetical protein
MPRDVVVWNYELGVQILARIGVPPEARIGVIDGLDTLTLGASLAANTRTAEELFADSIRGFLPGAIPEVPPDAPAPRALIARYRETRAMAT